MNRKILKCRKIDVLNVFMAVLFFLVNIFIQSSEKNASDSLVFLFSWVGVLVLGYILVSYKMVSTRIFTLYTIFILFLFLFNFGQCFLWAFGIHVEGEVGSMTLYRHIDPTEMDIVKTQMVFLSSALILHATVVRKTNNVNLNESLADKGLSNEKNRRLLFQASLILSIVVIPVSLYYNITQCVRASLYGYQAIYYGGIMDDVGGWVSIVNRMFIPCIMGLAIGSGNNEKKRNIVYAIFLAYTFIGVMFGDRGSWLYALVSLIWFHHTYHKKFRMRSVVLCVIIAYFSLMVLDVIVSLRNVGISLDNIATVLSSGTSNPIVSGIAEMGGSMGVTTLVVSDKPIYPYGNSYIMAFLSCITTKIPEFLGLQYSTLTKWLSQEYLNLSFGAGFTIIAEAIVNTNVCIAPLLFVLFGLIFRKFLSTNETGKDPIKLFASITVCTFLFALPRSTTHELLKNIVFGIVPFFIVIWLLRQAKR